MIFYNLNYKKMELPLIVQHLEKNGYVIVPNVLTKEEIENALGMFHSWRKSVPDLEYQHNTMDPHGIYKYHEIGHQKHAWYIRTRPKVKQAFVEIWKHYGATDPENMIVSYDGSCYISPECNKKDNYWTHTDQGSPSGGTEDELKCIQGFVALTSNKERTFTCYQGSHKVHAYYFKQKNLKTSSNWNVIDQDFIEKIKDRKKVLEVEAGSLVLWDSRTFHQNQYGKQNNGETRVVQYICMLPRSHPSNKPGNQKKRLKYFEERRTTSHWPCPVKVNGKQGRTFGETRKIIDYEKLPPPDLESMMEEIMKLV
jgi:hypothetical protein